MASNDQVLVDSIYNRWKKDNSLGERPDDEAWELFSSSQIMTSFSIALDQVERANVDGSGDGGIDSIFVLLDGELVECGVDAIHDEFDVVKIRRGVELSLHVIQSKQ